MHPRYRFHRAILLAVVTHFAAHAPTNVHGHVLSERGLHRKNRNVFRNNLPLIIPRGGEDQSNEENEEHDALATDVSNESEQPPKETPQEKESTEEKEENEEHDPPTMNTSNEPETPPTKKPKEKAAAEEAPLPNMRGALPQTRKMRHTSDVITDLMDNVLDKESYELRELIASRAQSYADDLFESNEKLPHPKRVLHYIAPKISAIKHSPDLMLRVQSSRAGIDAGVAACAIGTVAKLCELYDRQNLQESDDDVSVGSDVVKDRRFQQLVECALCGVDVRQRTQKAERMKGDGDTDETGESRDIEEVLDEEDLKIDEGLSVQDACRAAWGIAILGGLHVESFSEVATEDILTALSLRSRELLLARLQLLRQGNTQKQAEDGTLVERLDQDAEELAEDAASAMWAFACVKACTGIRSVPLFEACCSILCQNPDELRERAQAAKEGLDGSNFEENDVLERLARSEIDDSANEAVAEVNRTKTNTTAESRKTNGSETLDVLKDALLDWLSPNEVTDVLWALALHGSRVDTDSKEETALSETAAAFREIAFDRLVTWLHCDMDVIEQVKRNDMDPPSLRHEMIETKDSSWVDGSDASTKNDGSSGQGEILVEVVDAAALLASSAAMETEVIKAVENISVEDDYEEAIVKQVQVVDAATLLARTPEKVHVQTETEVLVASTSSPPYKASVQSVQDVETVGETSAYPELSTTSRYAPFQPDARMSALLRSGKLSFSPHDLCSITWAVTDLRDPLQFLIVDLITQMFASFGKESMTSLSMGDLSNLAWGIARSATQNKGMSWTEYLETPSATVTRWITKCALARLKLDLEVLEENDAESAVLSMLREFQPPELGRLMWSLCFTIANNLDPFTQQIERNVAMSRLAMLALLTAGNNLSIFGTEDLTRISWAFLELCDAKEALSQPLVAESLGRALSAVESSLLFWESGPRTRTNMRSGRVRVEDSFHFSTFFGTRFPLLLLNHAVNEHDDDEDENPQTYGKLPLLCDLTVDPSSLCKLVSGFTALSENQHFIEGGWTFLRVAVRLLASKNGQLMEQCPIGDVIRLCHACATSTTNGREQEQVVHLFARRVVQFMNEALDPDLDAHGKAADRLAHASPWEISILIWSLGELGARHFTTDKNRRLAYRKLHLITDRLLLKKEELQSLSAASTANLVCGSCRYKDNRCAFTHKYFFFDLASRYRVNEYGVKRPIFHECRTSRF
jgi:hypothetical protein